MKEHFRNAKLSKLNLATVDIINDILIEYRKQGYILTLRQLYYQLVSRDIIPNQDKEYAKLSHVLKEARMGGLVDWASIEDRIRIPKIPYIVDDVDDAIDDTINMYRLDRMKDQNTYIEVWIEKDALSSVFYRVTKKYGIRLMVNRGYSSVSAMYKAAERIMDAPAEESIIFYFGDHDPSGLDMVRDIQDRLEEFGTNPEVIHCALTMEQIEQYNPPPNPAKVTDPRAKLYIQRHGNTSWELDALQPSVLEQLVKDYVLKFIDLEQYKAILDQEVEDKKTLENFKDGTKND